MIPACFSVYIKGHLKLQLNSNISLIVVETCNVYVQEGEVKKEEIKEENVFIKIKMEVPSPSTEEDTCTVYIKEEYVEMANIEMTGNDKIKLLLSYLFTRRGT